MLRKLLTLIAICAGLTAVAEPARAAAVAVESVSLIERSSVPCVSHVAERLQLGNAMPSRLTQDKGKPCPKPTIVVIVPTVMLQVDRSRE